jgi:CheY-like chemotaxis protein
LTDDSLQPSESRNQAAASNAIGPVLLADDDESIRIATRACLEALGFDDIRVAANGDECLRMLTDRPVSVLLIDLLMPGADGRSVLRAVGDLPEEQRPGRIVVMSGIDDTKVAADLVAMGADVVLPKPFLLAELRAALLGGETQKLSEESDQTI